MEGCLTLCWYLQADNRLNTLCFQCSSFFCCKISTVSIISLVLTLGCNLLLTDFFKAFWSTIAIISLTILYQLLCILLVKLKSFRLNIRTIRTTYNRTFIPLDSKPGKSVVKILQGLFCITLPISILDTQQKLATLASCEEIIIECSAHSSDVL